jgi:hypothetical protein
MGLQWIALQSLAWTSMLIDYSRDTLLCRAIAQTFDGAHPCSLCQLVNKGNASEKKSDMQSPAPKIDIICVVRALRLIPDLAPFENAARDFCFSEIGHSPPVPPPRNSFVA